MGKNTKMINSALWAQKNPGKAKKMEDRFGVNIRQGAGWKSDSGETYEDYQESSDWHNKMTNAARNDYDLRRTLEAAAMSGKGKADKILKKGFNNLEDVSKAMNFSEKAAKRHGQGGDFTKNSDYMGLTRSMVVRDRQKQTEDYRREFASIKDMNALRDDLEAQEEQSQYQNKPLEKSDALARAEDRLSEAESSPGSIYGQNNDAAATDNPPADASAKFLYDYRDKVKEKYGPLTNTEREVSNAAKRVQDGFGR